MAKNPFNKKYHRPINRQSDMHHMLKDFFAHQHTNSIKENSQLGKQINKSSTRVILTDDDKAYWVKDNTFFVADTNNGLVDHSTAKQIDTINMSENDLDKMLFILDKLRDGNHNDRGGSGN